MSHAGAMGVTSAALLAKTGKDLAAWVEVAKASGVGPHMALVAHLKEAHGLGHGHANSVAHALNGTASISIADDELIAAMFAGPKSVLRPLYDQIMDCIEALGDDVELAPKKGYMSVRRAKQFAIVQPSTKDRLDLGLNLKTVAPAGRLEAAGSWNAMVTHRVRLAPTDAPDDELKGWLRAAFDAAGARK